MSQTVWRAENDLSIASCHCSLFICIFSPCGSCLDVAAVRVTSAKAEGSNALRLRERQSVLELECNCFEAGDVGQTEHIQSPSLAPMTYLHTNQIASGHINTGTVILRY